MTREKYECPYCKVQKAGSMKNDIGVFLRENHKGKERAIYSKDLEDLFGITGRTVRKKVSALRQEGYPICSNCRGYYYADTQDEIDETVERIGEFISGITTSLKGLMFSLPDPEELDDEIAFIVKIRDGQLSIKEVRPGKEEKQEHD